MYVYGYINDGEVTVANQTQSRRTSEGESKGTV